MKTYKFEQIAIVKNQTTLGFINGNSVAELKRTVKADKNYNFRNHGIIEICFDDRESVKMNSNKF